MSNPPIAELQRLARAAFGRELDEAAAEACRGRLPTMARAVRLLEASRPRLRGVEPALVHRVPTDETSHGRR